MRTELEKSKVTLYRSCAMRLAYLSADLLHLQFCANRLVRGMSKPTTGHWNSCAVFEDARTMDSRIPSSGTNEFDRHLHRFGLGK